MAKDTKHIDHLMSKDWSKDSIQHVLKQRIEAKRAAEQQEKGGK